MRTRSVAFVALVVAVCSGLGCSSSSDDSDGSSGAPGSSGAGGAPPSSSGAGGSSGSATTAAGTNSTSAGSGSGGTAGNGANGGRGGGAGMPSSGGGAGGRSNGGAGGSSGGRANGGSTSGGSTSGGGTSGGNGNGGSGSCVPNLACKLSPPASTGDIHQDCVDRINQFLTQCACLPALTRRTDGEACADQMSQYDAEHNTAHAGFTAKICTPAGSQNECPGYSSNSQVIGLCMQQMWDEGPPPTSTCTGDCYEEHGHFINMTDKTVTRVACGFYTTDSGKVWAAQNFSR